MRRFLLSPLLALVVLQAGIADPVISEFMASNQDSITDEDGGHSDWIEIYNPDGVSVNLAGWSLTDDAGALQKWVFPSVDLPAGGVLIVFASNKDRRIPGHELHTNFALSANGEYLALVKPDGVTKTSEFNPFPAQFSNISYGVSSPISVVTLVQRGSPVRAQIPTSAVDGTTWRSIGFNDSGWLSGTLAVGFFNYNGTSGIDLSSQLGLDVKAQMGGNDKSAYIRVPFVIDNPAQVESLKLRINYDDGFAAFVNGVPAASSNAPAPLAYNSIATSQRNPTGAVEYDITDEASALVAGGNILAIQGLNTNNSSDFFAMPEVVAEINRGASTGYFATATPGMVNGGPETIQLPQTITASRASGPFTSTFTLTLSGAASGQQIRYIIADPSSNVGAAVPAPTLSSTLYTGPVTIGSSKLIRAAVFDPANGQSGPVKTLHYPLLETGGTNNTSNFTSVLPIAVIDGFGTGDGIIDDYKDSLFYIFDRVSGTASLNSVPTTFTRSGFRTRGSSSQNFPKRAYAMKTWNEVDQNSKLTLLGLEADSSWIWYNPWKYDDAYIRNAFMFQLSRDMGDWASRTQPVEMFLNINGGKLDYSDYWGVYVLTEKIESGKNRLDITSIGAGDTSGDALTGGYIIKYDRADADETSWYTSMSDNDPSTTTGDEARLVLVEPDRDIEQPEQVAYIKDYINRFETALLADYNSNFATRNYTKYIDVPSWVDVHMLNSFAINPDSFRLSSFFHKDRNGKLKAGPIWDFDRGVGADKDAGETPDTPREWNGTHFDMSWWKYVLHDPEFIQAWVDRWWELRSGSGAMTDANINAIVTQFGNEIGNVAGARDVGKWPDNAPEAGTYLGEIAAFRDWLTSTNAASLGRTNWIDTQVPGPPSASLASGVVSAGTSVTLSGANTIRYTVNNTDPRPAGGGNSSAATYGAAITINQTTVLKARRRNTANYTPFPHNLTTQWSAPLTRVYLVNEAFAVASDISVSEINYDPAPPNAAEKAAVMEVAAGDFEFIELRNTGNRTVNTFEMQFVEGLPFKALKLLPLTLAPGDFALVVKNREAFAARYGTALNSRIVGEWRDGNLSNDGEEIKLLARDGTTAYDAPYSPIAKNGLSLNRLGNTWKTDVPSPGAFGPTYARWTAFYFPNGGSGSAVADDPDSDTAANQLEYSRGTDPTVAEDQILRDPSFSLVNDGQNVNYAFTYQKPTYRPSAQYQVQKSTDLMTWTAVSDTLVSATDGVETRAVTTAASSPKTTEFYRLKTTVSP
jgi:hypothetical protein